MARNGTERLWEVLDLFEDYLYDGYRSEHPPAPINLNVSGAGPVVSNPVVRGIVSDSRSKDDMETLRRIEAEIAACTQCGLHAGRTKTVPGTGVFDPLVMVIGEGPGADEDRTGLPFVGAAGRYLDKLLDAIGLSRSKNCYIANIVKCRPPGNRDPLPDEMRCCLPYLEHQISVIRPKAILSVGRISSQVLTGQSIGITRLRGRYYEYKDIPLVPTFHPSGVLRNTEYRAPVWEDLKLLKQLLDRAD